MRNNVYFLTEIDSNYDDNQTNQVSKSLSSPLSGEKTGTSHHTYLGVLHPTGSSLGVLHPISSNLVFMEDNTTTIPFKSLNTSAKCNESTFMIQSDATAIVHLSNDFQQHFFVLICAILTQIFTFHLYYRLIP